MKIFIILCLTTVLVACGSPSTPSAPAKIEGPDVKSLSHEDLMAMLKECDQYGRHDDPKVKYTERYCAAVTSAHARERAPDVPRNVDPTLNRLH